MPPTAVKLSLPSGDGGCEIEVPLPPVAFLVIVMEPERAMWVMVAWAVASASVPLAGVPCAVACW